MSHAGFAPVLQSGRHYMVTGVLLCCMATGCASVEESRPDVLSGHAPVEQVIAVADAAARSESYEAALALYRQVLSRAPDADIWYRTGAVLRYLDRSEEAVNAFERALELEPDHLPSLRRLGLYYTKRADPARATVYLFQVLAIDPRDWRAHNALGVLADLDGRFADAVEHYIDALAIRPDLPLLINNLGYSRYLLGNYTRAMFHMKAALEIDPEYDVARRNLALIYARQGKYDLALHTLLERMPRVVAYTEVGELALRMGRLDRAVELLRTAISSSATYNARANSLLETALQRMPGSEARAHHLALGGQQ